MGLQCERDGGMIPKGYRVGGESTLEPIGCDQMSMGKPMKPLVTLCPLSSIINFFQKLVEAVNSLGRERHGSLIACLI